MRSFLMIPVGDIPDEPARLAQVDHGAFGYFGLRACHAHYDARSADDERALECLAAILTRCVG